MTRYQAEWADGYRVLWRNLTWAEYRRYYSLWKSSPFKHPMGLAMEIYRVCRIEGPEVEMVPAGIADFIATQQMASNPFNGEYADIRRALDLARSGVQKNFLLGAKAIVATAFGYKFEEIDEWDADTFFIRLAQAEIAANRPIEAVNPKEVQNPQHAPPRPKNRRELALQRRKEQAG